MLQSDLVLRSELSNNQTSTLGNNAFGAVTFIEELEETGLIANTSIAANVLISAGPHGTEARGVQFMGLWVAMRRIGKP